jgi:hypothetical protein
MANYTEEQLKRAFEWAFYATAHRSKSGIAPLTREQVSKPLKDVHKNASLFLWNSHSLKWSEILEGLKMIKPDNVRKITRESQGIRSSASIWLKRRKAN